VSAETGSTDFHASSSKALLDPSLRANFRRAMDGLMAKRAAQFPDPAEWEALRSLAASIRARTLAKLPELLDALETRCAANGIRVHWAETTDDANEIVLGILRARGATRLVKGKSMVSEEMHLNDFLEKNGVESLESDLGEYIIQLDGETPSHIIMPAIHKSRQQIARLFGEKIRGAEYTEDVDALTATARRVLRRKFFEAEAGVSGVNIAVAETGTLVLVENEGNGRMSTHVPPVHIALMGIEKVVEKLEDVAPILTVLTLEITSIKNMRLFLEVADQLGYAGDKIQLVLNRADSALGIRVADVEHSIGRKVDHTIVSDGRSVVYALNRGVPFFLSNREAQVSQDILRLARSLTGEPEKTREGARKQAPHKSLFAWR